MRRWNRSRSFSAAASAGCQTARMSSRPACGVFAIVSASWYSAWFAKPSRRARSPRRRRISRMRSLLSLSFPLSPRLTQLRQAFSRSARSSAVARNGSTADRVLAMTQRPVRPRSSAATAAARRRLSGRPASCAGSSRTSATCSSSARRFCANVVYSVASRVFSAVSRALSAAGRRAPRRSSEMAYRSATRRCSGVSGAARLRCTEATRS